MKINGKRTSFSCVREYLRAQEGKIHMYTNPWNPRVILCEVHKDGEICLQPEWEFGQLWLEQLTNRVYAQLLKLADVYESGRFW